jgi:hypothetical protein
VDPLVVGAADQAPVARDRQRPDEIAVSEDALLADRLVDHDPVVFARADEGPVAKLRQGGDGG